MVELLGLIRVRLDGLEDFMEHVSLLNVTCYTVVTSRKVQALFGNYIFVPELVS